jgi:hypothetical protein
MLLVSDIRQIPMMPDVANDFPGHNHQALAVVATTASLKLTGQITR